MKINLTKIENCITGLFLFLLPWQARLIIKSGNLKNTYWEYGTISLYAIDIIFIILLILFLVRLFKKRGFKKLEKKNLWLITGAIGFAIANLVLSLNQILTALHLLWLIEGVVLFFILRQSLLPPKNKLLAFAGGAAVAGLLGLWQFITQTTFAFKWLGLAIHAPGELGTSVIEAIAPDGVVERWLRAYGPLDHPNILGGLCALALIFILYLVWQRDKKRFSIYDTSVIVSIIGLGGGLVSSFSRSGWLAAALGSISLVISSGKNKMKEAFVKMLPFFGIVLAIFILFAIPYYYLFTPRLSANSRLEQISITERFGGWKEAEQIILKHPIIGSGLGTYGLALQKEKPKELVWYYQPVHNTFLLIVAEGGIVGLLLLLFTISFIIKSAWKENRPLIISLCLGLVIIGLFDHWLFSLHFGILMSASVLALASSKKEF